MVRNAISGNFREPAVDRRREICSLLVEGFLDRTVARGIQIIQDDKNVSDGIGSNTGNTLPM